MVYLQSSAFRSTDALLSKLRTRTAEELAKLSRSFLLILYICFCIGSALLVRDALTSEEMDGFKLADFGVVSINLQYTINTGINFGLAGGGSNSRQILLAAIAIIVSIFILLWGYRSRQKWSGFAAGLFAGGGLANAFERLAYGGVFDYLNFGMIFLDNPFSFNLADVYIFAGLILYISGPKPKQ